jgi:hypothetical protein
MGNKDSKNNNDNYDNYSDASGWSEILAPRKKSRFMEWFENLFGKIEDDSSINSFGKTRKMKRTNKLRRSRKIIKKH